MELVDLVYVNGLQDGLSITTITMTMVLVCLTSFQENLSDIITFGININ